MGKLDGIIRDDHGIVIARRDRHPLADLLRAIPAGTAQTVFNMAPEMHHILAIHLFDNLDCSPPRKPLYTYREPSIGHSGLNGGIWAPAALKEEGFIAPPQPVTVPDPEGWAPEKIQAMRILLQQEEIRQGLVAGADPIYRGEGLPADTTEGDADDRA